ncbi:hypothetical protein, partial [Aquabacterium sp. UBA2148]|uniref:hypothetical protein n=1 Tax=Aquabacterium sp. UBA2148 TaxID=1946042 RepID=UPI00257A3E2C
MTLDAQATLGGNRLSLKGQAPRGLLNGQRVDSAGRWELDVQAPDIASLSPWAGAMGAERMRGRLSLTAQGAWPLQALTYRVSGQDIAATRADRAIWQLASVDGQGELDLSRADGRMSAKWSLQDARLSSWRLARLALSVDGSAASHRIRLDGEGAPVREGEVDTQRAVRLAVGVSGNWRSAAAERAWQARLSEAQLTWDQPRGRPALFRLEPTDLGWRVNDRQSEWL